MIIESIHIRNFRNFEELTETFAPGVNIFYGDNGSGKTNLLEALFVFSLGRSQRGAPDAVLVNDQERVYRLEGLARNADRSHEVAVAYEKGGRKKVTLDGVTIRLAELYEHFAAVAAGPEDNAILAGGPAQRRQFLDIYLSQFSSKYLSDLSDYQRCLSQKNAALKQRMDPAPFDDLMVGIGSRIMKARLDFIVALQAHAGPYYQAISGREGMTLAYAPSVPLEPGIDSPGSIEAAYRNKLARYRERERLMQVSLAGPHRDDFDITIGGFPARTHGSQGQLRTGAISLKLAVYHILKDRRRRPPILLLDEIFAELDDHRTHGLVEAFGGFSQLFLTTAVRPPEALLANSRSYRIKAGSVEEIH